MLFHDHKVCDGGGINRTASAGAHDGGNLGYHPAGHHVAPKYLRVSSQGIDAFLDAGAAAVIQTNHGATVFQRHVHNFTDFFGIGDGKRAADDGEILSKNIDQATVYSGTASYNSIAWINLFFHVKIRAAVSYEHIEFFETVRIHQQIDAFARGKLAFFMLRGNAFRASTQLGFFPFFAQLENWFWC